MAYTPRHSTLGLNTPGLIHQCLHQGTRTRALTPRLMQHTKALKPGLIHQGTAHQGLYTRARHTRAQHSRADTPMLTSGHTHQGFHIKVYIKLWLCNRYVYNTDFGVSYDSAI